MRTVRTIRTIEQVREYSVPDHITYYADVLDYIAGIPEDRVVSERVIDEVFQRFPLGELHGEAYKRLDS